MPEPASKLHFRRQHKTKDSIRIYLKFLISIVYALNLANTAFAQNFVGVIELKHPFDQSVSSSKTVHALKRQFAAHPSRMDTICGNAKNSSGEVCRRSVGDTVAVAGKNSDETEIIADAEISNNSRSAMIKFANVIEGRK